MYVVWAFIVILLFLHFDLSEITAFAHYTSTASPLQKHAHYPCFTLHFPEARGYRAGVCKARRANCLNIASPSAGLRLFSQSTGAMRAEYICNDFSAVPQSCKGWPLGIIVYNDVALASL